ncbi:MAG TPA: hypothetical protein VKX49_21605 [Bryobacteraceae bacterium]|nr:hypothetical protein [Bryobacteraceae bacterium]
MRSTMDSSERCAGWTTGGSAGAGNSRLVLWLESGTGKDPMAG